MSAQFVDREEGGRVLANGLSEYKNRKDLIVLALLRGVVPAIQIIVAAPKYTKF